MANPLGKVLSDTEPKTNLHWYRLRCSCKRYTLASKQHSNQPHVLS